MVSRTHRRYLDDILEDRAGDRPENPWSRASPLGGWRRLCSTVTGALLVLLLTGGARPETVSPAAAPVPPPSALPPAGPAGEVPPSPAQLRYEHERKSPGLALTIEGLCPIAGAGSIYTGTGGDQAAFLAVLSGLAAGAAVGSVFWLVHLDGQSASGVSRATLDLEQGVAISALVTAGLVYILARASGLSLAYEAADTFNRDLLRRLAAH